MLLYLISLVDSEDIPKIEYIYKEYFDDMMRFARYRLKLLGVASYNTDAEDVVQNVFVKLSKHIKKIGISVSATELRTYIFSLVANETANFLYDMKHTQEFHESEYAIDENDFFEALCIKERYDEVIRLIGQMDEKYSITLFYRYYKEMSVKQIASLMGISEKTVYTRLSRGKKLLLEAIKGDCNE